MSFKTFGEWQLEERNWAYLKQKPSVFYWENQFIKEENAETLLKIHLIIKRC